jgi:hypothetical protein
MDKETRILARILDAGLDDESRCLHFYFDDECTFKTPVLTLFDRLLTLEERVRDLEFRLGGGEEGDV